MTTDDELRELVAEARERNEASTWPIVGRLADSLEQVIAERDEILLAHDLRRVHAETEGVQHRHQIDQLDTALGFERAHRQQAEQERNELRADLENIWQLRDKNVTALRAKLTEVIEAATEIIESTDAPFKVQQRWQRIVSDNT